MHQCSSQGSRHVTHQHTTPGLKNCRKKVSQEMRSREP
uniref:Uncharacterized protein n=1 Tax=Arundo donax TaxID=35708 RepID=A0A0A8YIR0_ARUDO